MKKELKSGTEEFETFGDVFALYKEIGTVEASEEYWDDAVSKINVFMNKHNTILGRELGLAIMATLTEESKEQRYVRLLTFCAIEALGDKEYAHRFCEQALRAAEKWIKED